MKFLTGFEQIYVGNNPANNSRARLCVFQLIHVPVHIEWNGSIRTGSQATVERAIGAMGQKIKSRRLPFANLTNLIIHRERVCILGLYYPDLQRLVRPGISDTTSKDPVKATCPIQIKIHESEDSNSATFLQLQALLTEASIPGDELQFNAVVRFGKIRLQNMAVLQSEIYYQYCGPPRRKSCWFWVGDFLYRFALN